MIFPRKLNDFNSDLKAEEYKKFIKNLFEMGFLHVPEKCERCNGTKIHVQNLTANKNNKVCYRCMNDECKNIISIRQNSFFENHTKIPLKYLYDIFKCFTLCNFNAEEALKYLYEENKRKFLKETILTVYSELRQELRKYYYREYMTKPFVEAGNMNFTDFSIISIDEAVFAIEKVCEKDFNKPENKFISIKQERNEGKEKQNILKKGELPEQRDEGVLQEEIENVNNKHKNKSDIRNREAEVQKVINEKLLQDKNKDKMLNEELKKETERENKKELFGGYKEGYKGEESKNDNKNFIDKKNYVVGNDGKIRPNYRLRLYWVLGMINTVTQDFRVMLIPDRSMATLKTYITKYIKGYNTIITDCYKAYSFLDADILKLKIKILLSAIRAKKKEDIPKLTKQQTEEINQFTSQLLNIRNYYCYSGKQYIHIAHNHSKFEFGRGI